MATPPPEADAEQMRLWPLLAAWLKLRLITAQRGEDVLRMRWGHLDLPAKLWTQPADLTKNGQANTVPLSPLAMRIVKKLQPPIKAADDFVFAGIISARARHGICRGLDILDFQYRDLRRTAATNIGKLKASRFIIKRILNHVDAEVTSIYDRNRYDDEKRSALDAWASYLTTLTAKKTAAA